MDLLLTPNCYGDLPHKLSRQGCRDGHIFNVLHDTLYQHPTKSSQQEVQRACWLCYAGATCFDIVITPNQKGNVEHEKGHSEIYKNCMCVLLLFDTQDIAPVGVDAAENVQTISMD